MERLFWPNPVLMNAIVGDRRGNAFVRDDEQWLGELEETMRATIGKAIEPAQTYLKCFQRWEQFLSVDVDAYVAGLTHVLRKQPDEEEESDEPPVKVDLVALRKTLKKHRDERLEIERLVPSTPVNAGLFMTLDASAARKALTEKHLTIAKLLLEDHAANCSELAAFIDGKFKAVETNLKKKPADIETTTELRDYIENTVANETQPLEVMIREMRKYGDVLSEFEYRVPYDQFEQQGKAAYWPVKISTLTEEARAVVEACREQYLEDMTNEQDRFEKSLHALEAFSNSFVQYQDLSAVAEAAKRAEECHEKIAKADEKAKLFNSRELLFQRAEVTDYEHLAKIKKDFEPYYLLWSTSQAWLTSIQSWQDSSFLTLDAPAIEKAVSDYYAAISKAHKFFERNQMQHQANVARDIKQQIAAFKPNVPIVVALRNHGMRDRHWNQVGTALGVDNFVPDDTFTLAALLELNPMDSIDFITKVSEAANKEYNIEQTLNKMFDDWKSMDLQIAPYRGDIQRLIVALGVRRLIILVETKKNYIFF